MTLRFTTHRLVTLRFTIHRIMSDRLTGPGWKYAAVGWIGARSSCAYIGEMATRTLFLATLLFIFLQLWRVTYQGVHAALLGGLTLPQMLWYLVMTEAITLSAYSLVDEIDSDVRTGGLAIYLIRPISYPFYRYWTYMGERSVRFALNLLAGAVIALVYIGPVHLSLMGLFLFALALPLSFSLEFAFRLVIGLGAFWMEDTSGIALIYSRLTMILGGMLFPLSLFPESMQGVLRVLPFSSLVYGPARMFVQPNSAFLAALLLRQAVALLLTCAVATALYRVALKRVQNNGG